MNYASKILAPLLLFYTFSSCDQTNNQSATMEQHQKISTNIKYTCPMHPEVTGKEGDKCSKCGMALKLLQEEQYTVSFKTQPEQIVAGRAATLSFDFNNHGEKVSLDLSHEMKVHLMVISNDLTWFRHIHPEEQSNGSYTVTETFPYGGKYLLFTDFKPSGSAASILNKQEIEVTGKPIEKLSDYPDKFISEVDGYKVVLENGNDFKTNQEQSFHVSLEKGGKKLSGKDIEPYLGANAHIVMVSKTDKDFLHIHPVNNQRFPIYAQTHIEKPGIYRIWVQFQADGAVHVADFTVNVKEGKNTGQNGSQHSHHH